MYNVKFLKLDSLNNTQRNEILNDFIQTDFNSLDFIALKHTLIYQLLLNFYKVECEQFYDMYDFCAIHS